MIQYKPTTPKVLETPLVIFPPWINRYYILDLDPKKSFIRWAVEQGLTVFVVSWKSADASMGDLTQDDYIRAQIEAIDAVRERLKVPATHTLGYCVAGTTLAATLAVLARRGEAEKVASTTFFTAQVDFERAGDLKIFIDDLPLKLVDELSEDGYLDGRYLAATFNLLRGRELIWNYVINNYLMGKTIRRSICFTGTATPPISRRAGTRPICATFIATTNWWCPMPSARTARRSISPASRRRPISRPGAKITFPRLKACSASPGTCAARCASCWPVRAYRGRGQSPRCAEVPVLDQRRPGRFARGIHGRGDGASGELVARLDRVDSHAWRQNGGRARQAETGRKNDSVIEPAPGSTSKPAEDRF